MTEFYDSLTTLPCRTEFPMHQIIPSIHRLLRSLFILFLVANSIAGLSQGSETTPNRSGFVDPPVSAKPRVWWHWMNGNISKEGIKKDLLWMNRVGLGGFQNFDASLFTPQVVKERVVYMTPEWIDAFRYATRLADSLQLEMAIAGSPGWSVTGGPWVPASDGMKKYVWTETFVTGGKVVNQKLREPSHATGKFQNHKLESTNFTGTSVSAVPSFYADAAVVAFRLTSADKPFASLNPKVSSSGGTFSVADLTDGDLENARLLPPGEVGEETWIQYEFPIPQTFKAFTVCGANHLPLEDFNGGPTNRSLQVSDDGTTFREVAKISGSIVPQNTVSILPATGKYFRFVIKTLPPIDNPFAAMMGASAEKPKPVGVNVSEFVLHTTDRIDQFEDKTGFTPWSESGELNTGSYTDKESIVEVVDLSQKMKSDGTLSWEAPKGNWSIIRFGYSLTGRQNHPASPEATGLEVDKLDKEAVSKYMETYLNKYKEATGGMMGASGLTHMVLDSYEAGHMTWTKNFPAEFRKRRGYDITRWIPVLTGRVVSSGEESEKFLWDFRKTIGELIVENHYDAIGEILHRRGMKRYTESHENKRIYLADGMDVKRKADVPMSAMWTPGSLAASPDEEIRSRADIRESASVAHIYGQNIVAAESMTAIRNSFAFSPERLKRTADMEMASGVNRFIIHTSVHQPLDDKKPGLSLGPFGQWFTRHETWAEQAGAWVDYLARSSYMLQQGKQVANILYYYGENNNITQLCTQKLPSLPAGYEFDFVNANTLKEIIQAKDKKLVAPSGMEYNILVLDESARLMTLAVLKKIRDLAKSGVRIAGTKPEKSPSLSDNPKEFREVLAETWKLPHVSSKDIGEMLKDDGITEDVIISKASSEILYVHRKTNDQDIYWLNNRSDLPTDAEISFRITGKLPELWNPLTGEVEKVSYEIKDGRTILPLRFESWDAFFIVFTANTTTFSYRKPELREKHSIALTSPWQVNFEKGRGAPASAQFTALKSLHENADPGIKYFSGTASYNTTFNSPSAGPGYIDLGDAKNVAEVFLNGKSQGIVWKKPFSVTFKDALQKGNNTLEIRVTNLWVNRLIGDAQPGVAEKTTYTTMPFYKAENPLLPSGLIGPVVVKVVE